MHISTVQVPQEPVGMMVHAEKSESKRTLLRLPFVWLNRVVWQHITRYHTEAQSVEPLLKWMTV